jgi:hypothetical protein
MLCRLYDKCRAWWDIKLKQQKDRGLEIEVEVQAQINEIYVKEMKLLNLRTRQFIFICRFHIWYSLEAYPRAMNLQLIFDV